MPEPAASRAARGSHGCAPPCRTAARSGWPTVPPGQVAELDRLALGRRAQTLPEQPTGGPLVGRRQQHRAARSRRHRRSRTDRPRRSRPPVLLGHQRVVDAVRGAARGTVRRVHQLDVVDAALTDPGDGREGGPSWRTPDQRGRVHGEPGQRIAAYGPGVVRRADEAGAAGSAYVRAASSSCLPMPVAWIPAGRRTSRAPRSARGAARRPRRRALRSRPRRPSTRGSHGRSDAPSGAPQRSPLRVAALGIRPVGRTGRTSMS